MKIEFIDLKQQYQAYKDEIDQQMQEVITNASFIMGKQIGLLEENLAAFVGVNHCISCASGTDALLLALMSYGLKADDEIVTTAFSFIATSEIISFLGANPVFVDIDPETFNIDPQKIEAVITPKTKGIIVADLFGQCADYDAIETIAKEKNLFVIEDAAQSFGAKYQEKEACSLTEIGCTSFFPAKPLGCFGDGGAVFTNDDAKAELMKSFRTHGSGSQKYEHTRIGLNARLDTLQAAILLVKLKHFPQEIINRNKAAEYYDQNLCREVITPKIRHGNLSVYGQYVIKVEKREELQKTLKEKGIPTAIHYPKALHLQPAFSYLGYKEGDFPIAESVCNKVLALPMHPFLTEAVQNEIVTAINSFYER